MGEDLPAYTQAVKALPHGKRLPDAVYVHKEGLSGPLGDLTAQLAEQHGLGDEYNVIKFRNKEHKLSFLSYPDFASDPHPALKHVVTIDLATGKVAKADYSKNANPPILHRKESFIPKDHPDAKRFKELSDAEEAMGLLGGKKGGSGFIGFRKQWKELLASRGITIRGGRLVPSK